MTPKKPAKSVPPGARYENTCPDCTLLEQHGQDDLYHCKIYKERRTGHASTFYAPMLIVVQPDGEELACPVAMAQEIGKREPRFARAFLVAREKGMIHGDPMKTHVVALADEHRVEPNAMKRVLDDATRNPADDKP